MLSREADTKSAVDKFVVYHKRARQRPYKKGGTRRQITIPALPTYSSSMPGFYSLDDTCYSGTSACCADCCACGYCGEIHVSLAGLRFRGSEKSTRRGELQCNTATTDTKWLASHISNPSRAISTPMSRSNQSNKCRSRSARWCLQTPSDGCARNTDLCVCSVTILSTTSHMICEPFPAHLKRRALSCALRCMADQRRLSANMDRKSGALRAHPTDEGKFEMT